MVSDDDDSHTHSHTTTAAMLNIYERQELPVPAGVTVSIKTRVVTVEGPRGKLVRNLGHLSVSFLAPRKDLIVIEMHHGNRKQVACLRTVRSIINNMIIGVTRGFKYKMRYVYGMGKHSDIGLSYSANLTAHFPINVNLEKNAETGLFEVEIRYACNLHLPCLKPLLRLLRTFWGPVARDPTSKPPNLTWDNYRLVLTLLLPRYLGTSSARRLCAAW